MSRRNSITSIFQAKKSAQAAPSVLALTHIPKLTEHFLLIAPEGDAKIIDRVKRTVFQTKQISPSVREEFEAIRKLFPKKISGRKLFAKTEPAAQNDLRQHADGKEYDLTKILPKEIVSYIMTYLDPASYSSIVQVSKSLKNFESETMWHFYCKKYLSHNGQRKDSWKYHFISEIQSQLYVQSDDLVRSCFVFRLFETKWIVTGGTHETSPILVGRPVGGERWRNMIIGKAPDGRMVIIMPEYQLANGVDIVYSEINKFLFKSFHNDPI